MADHIPEGSISIKIAAGKNLAAKDRTGLSDPYCVIGLATPDNEFETLYPTPKTNVVKQNLNPYWKEQFFTINPTRNGALRPIRIEVFDQDLVPPDEFMGQVTIAAYEYEHGKPVDKWFPLKQRPNKGKDKVSGELHVLYTFNNPKKAAPSPGSSASTDVKPKPSVVVPGTSTTTTTTSTETAHPSPKYGSPPSSSSAAAPAKPQLAVSKPPSSPGSSSTPPAFTKMASDTALTTKPAAPTTATSSGSAPLTKSKSDHELKKAAAQHESAWTGKGKEVGLWIWRIEKFHVRDIPRESYGRFFNGDSYIVLNTYERGLNKSQTLLHDVHFWLGSKTTQDEMGTAAYKTVELDDFLDGLPVQHREVEGHESDLFLSYFKGPIVIMEGGIESGFNKVKPHEYQPRLLQLKGRHQVRIVQVPLSYKSLNGGDVFILDTGLKLFQWNGNLAGGAEKHKAAMLCRTIVEERRSEPKVTVYHEGEKGILPEFWGPLGGEGPVASASQGGDDEAFEKSQKQQKRLFKLSDASGQLTFTQIGEGVISRKLLTGDDAFIFDTGTEIFAWIGSRASAQERKQALKYAQDYLTKFNRPAYLTVSRILEGGVNTLFESHFDAD